MLCNEPILRTYLKAPLGHVEFDDSFVAFVGGKQPAFYTTAVCSLVLETRSCYVEVASCGVSVHDKTKPIADQFGDKYLIQEELDETVMLFAGERVHGTRPNGEYYDVVFDDFALRVELCQADRFPCYAGSYVLEETPVHGYDRYLKAKCECGGSGKIWLDHVDDYFIRCDSCHKSTRSHMAITEAIKAWNKRDTPRNIDFTYEQLDEFLHSTIHKFAVLVRHASPISEQSCDCEEVIMETDRGMLHIELNPVSKECCTFAFIEFLGYNPEEYAWIVKATPDEPFTFLDKIYDDEEGVLCGLKFKYGDRFLFLYTSEYDIIVTKSIVDLEGDICIDELPDYDDSLLFNEVYRTKAQE